MAKIQTILGGGKASEGRQGGEPFLQILEPKHTHTHVPTQIYTE